MVNIEGLNKADVLAALYNATNPGGMGLLQASRGPNEMDRDFAESLISYGSDATREYPIVDTLGTNSSLSFDYVYGRCLKVDLTDGVEFDPWGFDRDNGEGAAQKVIDHLRETGSVQRADGTTFEDTTLTEEESQLYMAGLLANGSF